MRTKLYKVNVKRLDRLVTGYLTATSEDRAAEMVVRRELALGLETGEVGLERIDESLPEIFHNGLDELLEGGRSTFTSYCDLGWQVHPDVREALQFYRTKNPHGKDLFALAPNFDVASVVFGMTLLPFNGTPHTFEVTEGFGDMSEEEIGNLPELITLGSIGLVAFNETRQRWLWLM